MKIKKKNRCPVLKFGRGINIRKFDFKKNKLLDRPIKEKFNKNNKNNAQTDYLFKDFLYKRSYSISLWWNE